jgi:hypothetical protein
MSEQDNYIVFIADAQEFICNNEPELISILQTTSQLTSREIRFFKDKQYNERISRFYNKKYNIYV